MSGLDPENPGHEEDLCNGAGEETTHAVVPYTLVNIAWQFLRR